MVAWDRTVPTHRTCLSYEKLNSNCELIDGLGSNATDTSNDVVTLNYNMDPGWSKISGVWDAESGIWQRGCQPDY